MLQYLIPLYTPVCTFEDKDINLIILGMQESSRKVFCMIKYDVVVIIMSEHEEETLPLLVANHAKKQSEKVETHYYCTYSSHRLLTQCTMIFFTTYLHTWLCTVF